MSRFELYKVDRPIIPLGYDIWEHYWKTLERWNKHLEVNIEKDPHDQRTREYKALQNLYYFLYHFSDAIHQTEREHRAEVWKLKCKLGRWEYNRGRKPSLSAEQKKQVKELHADGESCRSLGRKFGVSDRTIRRVIKGE